MSFLEIRAISPIKVRATMTLSKKIVAACTVVLNIFGEFILYIRISPSMARIKASTMITTILY